MPLTPKQRRFDSIAWIIQEDQKEKNQKCGAACFDGNALLLATNKHVCTDVLNKVKNYLIIITIKYEELFKQKDEYKKRKIEAQIKNEKRKLKK